MLFLIHNVYISSPVERLMSVNTGLHSFSFFVLVQTAFHIKHLRYVIPLKVIPPPPPLCSTPALTPPPACQIPTDHKAHVSQFLSFMSHWKGISTL